NREVTTLNNMLNHGVTWGRIGFNPIAGLKPLAHDQRSKERRSLSLQEVESLFANSPDYLKPVWRMFMCTGIRRSELVELRFADVDFDRRVVVISAARAKNRRAREIPLDDTIVAELQTLRDQAKARTPAKGTTVTQTASQAAAFSREHVFVTQANTPLRNNLLKRFYAICKKAGIDGAEPGGSIDIHSLRVSFATLSLEHGANPKAVQAILGHSTLALTMSVYARATERSKREAIGALPFAKTSAPDHIVAVQNAHALRTGEKSKAKHAAAQ
ncbi:MAG TPA: site-specific integrase, partial [Pirellulales bacterium]|nr:site-specific integrase [Pirellulales bacterium]